MEKVIISNWNIYADYMTFADIVSENKLSVILQIQGTTITCFGYEEHVKQFAEKLRKNKIKFVTA